MSVMPPTKNVLVECWQGCDMDWSSIIVGGMAATATVLAAWVLSRQNTRQHAQGASVVLTELSALDAKVQGIDGKVDRLKADYEVMFGLLASQDQRLNDAGIAQQEDTLSANKKQRRSAVRVVK